jgi:hypothetical protein
MGKAGCNRSLVAKSQGCQKSKRIFKMIFLNLAFDLVSCIGGKGVINHFSKSVAGEK